MVFERLKELKYYLPNWLFPRPYAENIRRIPILPWERSYKLVADEVGTKALQDEINRKVRNCTSPHSGNMSLRCAMYLHQRYGIRFEMDHNYHATVHWRTGKPYLIRETPRKLRDILGNSTYLKLRIKGHIKWDYPYAEKQKEIWREEKEAKKQQEQQSIDDKLTDLDSAIEVGTSLEGIV